MSDLFKIGQVFSQIFGRKSQLSAYFRHRYTDEQS